MTKILHIWDQAGVACVLAKYQRRIGHDVKVIKRASFDKFKSDMRRVFYQDFVEWKSSFCNNVIEVVDRALSGFSFIDR